jgi:hypothetical protein
VSRWEANSVNWTHIIALFPFSVPHAESQPDTVSMPCQAIAQMIEYKRAGRILMLWFQ